MRRACRPSPAWLRWALPVCAVLPLVPRPAAGQSCSAGPSFTVSPYPPGGTVGTAQGVVVGDFYGPGGVLDGKLDAVVTRSSSQVRLLPGNGDGSFGTPVDVNVGMAPRDLVAGDFDGDGLLDLALVPVASPVDTVQLLAGTGGGFGGLVDLPVGVSPSRLAVGDLDRDGTLDLVVASQSAGVVRVLIGNGDFTFAAYSPDLAIAGASAVAVGDFDRNGWLDLAVTQGAANQVQVYLGQDGGVGNLVLVSGATIGVGPNPVDIAAGDVDRDGALDLVTANHGDGTASVRNGDGMGGFGLTQTVDPTPPPVDLADPLRVLLQDFNRDGLLDLAVLDETPQNVVVFPGSGSSPPFDAANPVPVGLPNAVTDLTTGDLDADGRPDLVVTSGSTVTWVPNESGPDCPRASFGDAPRAFLAGDAPVFVAVADFDEDGIEDLVAAASAAPGALQFLKGSGNGYEAPVAFPTGTAPPRGVATADFNVDGHADVVAALGNGGTGQVRIFLGNGTGALAGGTAVAAGMNTSAVVTGDFNGDGAPDVAATSQATGQLFVFPGDALGGLGTPTITAVGGAPRALAAGHLNGDGYLDLVVPDSASNTVTVALGNGDGSFALTSLTMGLGPWGVALGDFDGNGALDIVTADHDAAPSSVTVRLGVGDGTFGAATSLTVPGVFPFAVAALDLTDDSDHDIAVVTGSQTLVLFAGNGTGGFAAPAEFAVRTRPSAIAAVDADFDGKPDLVIPCRDSDSVVVLLARPPVPPLFTEATKVGVGTGPTAVATADLDRDGDLDLAVVNSVDGTVSILENDPLGVFAVTAPPLTVGAGPESIAGGDFNRDGIPDLVVSNTADGTVSVLRGLGGGAFAAAESGPAGSNPDHIAVGDFDTDGRLEVAVVNRVASGTVTLVGIDPIEPVPVMPPYFTFSIDGTFTVGESPTGVHAADLDGDGKLDLAVVNGDNVAAPLDDDLTVLFGDGMGGFPDVRNLALGGGTSPESVTAGDFDLDGDLDLAAAVFASDAVALFANQGGRVFSSPGVSISAANLPQFLTTADVNRDGKPDLALAATALKVRRGRCSSLAPCSLSLAFEGDEDFVAGVNPTALVVADFNGDGLPDAAVANEASNDVSILTSTACVRRRLVVSTAPEACGTGAPPFPVTAVVEVQDDGENKLVCETGTVSAQIAPGTGPLGAILGGTLDVGVSLGEASFTDLNIDREGQRYRLQFDLTGVPSARSRSFTLGAGVVAISGPPSFCGGSSATYSVAGGYDRYLWTVDGAPASGSPSVVLVNPPLGPPTLPQEVGLGPHTLAVEARVDGCQATDSTSIYVGDLQSVTIATSGPTTVCVDCLGGTVTTTGTGGGTLAHQWGYRTTSLGPVTPIGGQTADTYVLNGLDFPGPGTYYLVETSTPTCGSARVSNEIVVTVTAVVSSGEVQSLGVTSRESGGRGQNVLQWVNTSGSLEEIRIRWNRAPSPATTCDPPPSPVSGPFDGEFVDSSPAPVAKATFVHGDLDFDTDYCYSVFTRISGAYAPGRAVKGRPFDTTVGPVKWAYTTGATAVVPPTVAFPGVLAMSNDRTVHSLQRGILGGLWPTPWMPEVLTGVAHSRSPVVLLATPLNGADSVLFVGDDAGDVVAVNAETGQAVWGPVTPFSPPLGATITGAVGGTFVQYGGPADVLLVGTRNNDMGATSRFVALNLANGSPADSFDGAPGGGLGPVSGTPAVDNTGARVYFGSRSFLGAGDTLWCLGIDASPTPTLTYQWSLGPPDLIGDIDGSPVVNNGRLYVASDLGGGNFAIHSVNVTNPADVRSMMTGDGPVRGFLFPDRRNENLMFATNTKVWSVADLPTGFSVNWTWQPGGLEPSILLYWPQTSFVYVGSKDGTLYQLDFSSGAPSATCDPYPGVLGSSCISLVLGDGRSHIGAPSLDVGVAPPDVSPDKKLLLVGSESGSLFPVEVPFP